MFFKNSLTKIVCIALFFAIPMSCTEKTSPDTDTHQSKKISVIFDTDANNELDDQHALAYLLFNGDIFDVRGVTVNATYNGGEIDGHYNEAERILKLSSLHGDIPLYAGANGDFNDIKDSISSDDYDGAEAVEFIIQEARAATDQPLVLLPVGKLTNIALALEKAPDIKENVRIVWLGANYPDPGEYNLENDIPSMNYILEQEVPFEMVMVRYGEPSGSDAVKVTPEIISEKMPGLGPTVAPVEGRHGNTFTNFGDYSISLFENIDLYGDPPGRALFDMVAVAILKNESWGEQKMIPAPTMIDEVWIEQPGNAREVLIWENFNKELILEDFFNTMNSPVLVEATSSEN